jgi:hypothetical protein
VGGVVEPGIGVPRRARLQPRVARGPPVGLRQLGARADHGLDAPNLIAVFSDGVEDDGNGYVLDDISAGQKRRDALPSRAMVWPGSFAKILVQNSIKFYKYFNSLCP